MEEGGSAAEAKRYLRDKQVPELFEWLRRRSPRLLQCLMTGLIFNKPNDPVDFLSRALAKIRRDPGTTLPAWDAFVDCPPPPLTADEEDVEEEGVEEEGVEEEEEEKEKEKKKKKKKQRKKEKQKKEEEEENGVRLASRSSSSRRSRRSSSALSYMSAAAGLRLDESVAVVLFMGGPGGGKTRHAQRLASAMTDKGLVYVSTTELVKAAIDKYKDKHMEWNEAAKEYRNGKLIPNHLALGLLKAEMAKHADTAKAFFLEGYPREPAQIDDFEKQVKKVSMALILDFDEETIMSHMKHRKVSDEVIAKKIEEFKEKTLPAAKYFDDRLQLHLIAGEQSDDAILHQLRTLVEQAMNAGNGDANNNSNSQAQIEEAAEEVVVEEEDGEVEEEEEEDELDAYPLVDVPAGLPHDAPVILIIGAPGSRKGQFCAKIADKYDGFRHISMGQLLRKKVESGKNGKVWKLVKRRMDRGDTLPLAVCRELFHKELHKLENSWGYVIEGYPRTLDQAVDFDKTVARVDMALLIDCTESYCLSNLQQRQTDETDSEKKAGRAEAEDTAEPMAKRLALFKKITLPMLKHFDEGGKLKVIPGDKGLDEIFQDICGAIEATLFIQQDNTSAKSLDSKSNSVKLQEDD